MKKIFLLLVVIFLLLVALPASATGTTISFDDAQNTTLSANTHTFTGSISTSHHPDDLTYRYTVDIYNDETFIYSHVWTQSISEGNWSFDDDIYSDTFSFTAWFGTHTGQMKVYLEVFKDGVRLTRQAIHVNVLPIQVSLNQRNNLVITERSYEFTGMVSSYTRKPDLSYTVLNEDDDVIAQSSSVTVTQSSTSSDLYTYRVKFNVNFGDYTGAAKVTLKANDGTRTAMDTITVILDRDVETSPTQYGKFKNRGQLVSYLVQELKTNGYGNHKNLGQALKYAVQHVDFNNITSYQDANRFIRRIIRSTTVKSNKRGKQLKI